MDKILDITQQVEALGKTAEHLATGLLAVDRLCGGLPRGGVTLVGGRPGMGCTSFALSIMHQIAQRQEGNILIFAPPNSKPRIMRADAGDQHGCDPGGCIPWQAFQRFADPGRPGIYGKYSHRQ